MRCPPISRSPSTPRCAGEGNRLGRPSRSAKGGEDERVWGRGGADRTGRPGQRRRRLSGVRLWIPPETHACSATHPNQDLENLSDDALRELYEARVAEARAASGREDLSDMVAAKAAAQKRKAAEKAARDTKKFKF